MFKRSIFGTFSSWQFFAVVAVFVACGACSRPAPVSSVKKIPAGQENIGFLSSYANLKPNPEFENTRTFVSQDPNKNIHRYIAVIVDYPAVYVSTDVDGNKIPDRGAAALAQYFQDAIADAVETAFPLVQSPGPLVLRLRSAIVGVDAGTTPGTVNIGKVGVEMELVDSETGQQVAAAVDRQNLGESADIAPAAAREEKFRAAAKAFDGWASRLRAFLDAADERSPEDGARIEDTNFAYDTPGAPVK